LQGPKPSIDLIGFIGMAKSHALVTVRLSSRLKWSFSAGCKAL